MAFFDSSVTGRLKMLLNLPKSAPLVWRLAWDRRVAWWRKAVFLGGALVYFLLPTDFISDFLPFIGQLDDLTVLVFFIERFIAGVPEYIIRENYR
ncbi:MAG: YkvA family protein [Bacillota bacterium]